jgi:hypothetical protein
MTFRSLLLAALVVPSLAGAQQHDTSSDRAGTGTIELWAGYSDHSTAWGVLGHLTKIHLGLAAGRATHRVATFNSVAWEYTFDVVPIALISPPLRGIIETPYHPACQSYLPCSPITLGKRFPQGSGYGYGFSPLGLTAIWRRSSIIQPRIGGTAGMLLFDRAVPTVLSTQFNFTTTAEAGVQFMARSGVGAVLAYRFHHISNAGTGVDNSAVASHIISLGVRMGSR